MKALVIGLVFLLLCVASSATDVEIVPDTVAMGTNREYNLTINNVNDPEPVTNITIESPVFIFTQAYSGAEWAVTSTDNKAHWYNGSIGTDVVHAVFPFRATSPLVESTTDLNFTITLYSPTRIQRLHRLIRVDKAASTPSYSVDTTVVTRGLQQNISLTKIDENVSEPTAHFLGQAVNISPEDNPIVVVNVPSDVPEGVYILTITGHIMGQVFEEPHNITVLPRLDIEINSPLDIVSSNSFVVKGRIVLDENRSLDGSALTVLWQNSEQKTTLNSSHEFTLGLVSPSESGQHTLSLELDHGGYLYKKQQIMTITTNAPETPNTPTPVNTSAKKIQKTSTLSLFELEEPPRKKSTGRTVILGLLITVLLVLIIVTLLNLDSKKMFFRLARKKRSGDSEEETGLPKKQPEIIDWETYFARRRAAEEKRKREHEQEDDPPHHKK